MTGENVNGLDAGFDARWKHHPRVQATTEGMLWQKTGWTPDTLRGLKVLDYGCGCGRFARMAGDAGALVTGIDKATAGRATGYILDLGELKRILHRAVVDKCDHRNLNTEVDFLHGTIPSTENLVIAFWREIAPHLPPAARLHRVRLYETPRNFSDYYGPDAP